MMDVENWPRYTAKNTSLDLPVTPTGESIRRIRESLKMSVAVFAKFLNVSVTRVQNWEHGRSTPEGSAARILDEIRQDPEYWRKRFRQMVKITKAAQSS